MASALRRQKSRSKLEEGRRIAAMGLSKINLGRFRRRYTRAERSRSRRWLFLNIIWIDARLLDQHGRFVISFAAAVKNQRH